MSGVFIYISLFVNRRKVFLGSGKLFFSGNFFFSRFWMYATCACACAFIYVLPNVNGFFDKRKSAMSFLIVVVFHFSWGITSAIGISSGVSKQTSLAQSVALVKLCSPSLTYSLKLVFSIKNFFFTLRSSWNYRLLTRFDYLPSGSGQRSKRTIR